MDNYQDVVAAILEACPSARVEAHLEEEAKAQVTRIAAWQIFQSNPNIGLLRKTSGNQMLGLSVDVLMDKTDGSWADCASATADDPGFVRITAPWSPHDGTDHAESHEAWLGRWVQPTLALAGAAGPLLHGSSAPAPPDPPPAEGPPPSDLLTLLRADVAALRTQQADDTATILAALAALEAKGDANTEKIQATFRQAAKDLAKQVRLLIPLLARERPG